MDAGAFQNLIHQHEPKIRALAEALLESRKIAEEVSLRVFSRAYTTPMTTGSPGTELAQWCIAQCRRLHWPAMVCNSVFTDALDIAEVKRHSGMDLLRRLPWNQRILLALREVAGLSVDEIAFVVDAPVENVRLGLLAARERLVKTLRGMNETKQ